MNPETKNSPGPFGAPSPYDGNDFNLRNYVQILWRRKWYIMVCFVVVMLAVGARILTSRPIFAAEATLEINQTTQQLLSPDTLFANKLGIGSSVQNSVLTEIQIIKSRTVAKQAAILSGCQVSLDKSRPIYEDIYKKLAKGFLRRFFGIKQADEGLPPAGTALKLYAKALKVRGLVHSLRFDLIFMKGGRFRVIREGGRVFCQGRIGAPCETGIFSFILRGEAPPAGSRFGLNVTPLGSAAGRIRAHLAATPIPNTQLIRLALTDSDPYEAKRLLSWVVSAYREIKRAQKSQGASQTVDFINKQLQTVNLQLQKAAGKLKQYKEEHKLMDLDASVQMILAQLAQTESARQEAQLLSSQLRFLLAKLEGKGSVDQKSLYTMGAMSAQPSLAALATSLTGVQAQRAALMSQYTDRYPQIQALDRQIIELKRKMRTEISSLLDSQKETIGVLTKQMKQTEAQLMRLPQAEQMLADLTRNAQVYQDIYTFMLQQKGQMQVTKAGESGDVWVVEPAYAFSGFIKPKIRRDLALGFVLGVLLGVGLAFFMEYLDDSVKNPEDIQTLGTVPVLGNIGHLGRIEKDRQDHRFLVLLEEPDSHVSEAFRSLRSNLLFTSVDKARQLILLSSALPQEGKSTCAANLSVALAHTGKKVLLVDADLRRPVQHRIFRCKRSPGIVNVLVSEDWEKALAEAIQTSEVNGLDLLVCGDTPPNPNEMIGSEKMGQVIDTLRRAYDFVLFDSPPVLSVSDALVLAQRLDGVLCVARAGRTSRKALRSTFELLAQVRIPVMGVVLNDIDFTRERYYYGYHYKYYNSYYGKKEEDGGKIRKALARFAKKRKARSA